MPDRNSIIPFDAARADRNAFSIVQGMVNNMLATVRLARSFVQTNREIDLAGLDRDVGLLCARALDLPQPLGRKMRPHLNALRKEIEALSLAMTPAQGDQS